MWNYPVRLSPDTNGTILVQFVDLDEAHTFGETKLEALEHGLDALLTAFAGYMKVRRAIPYPSSPKAGQDVVTVPTLAALKVTLYRVMLDKGIRKIDLARRMDIHPPQVDRVLDLLHGSKLEQLERAFAAVGMRLDFGIVRGPGRRPGVPLPKLLKAGEGFQYVGRTVASRKR